MWRYAAVWLLDKAIARLSAHVANAEGRGETVRGEVRKILAQLRLRCQPPVDAPLRPAISSPTDNSHWLRKALHPLLVPFLYAIHFVKSVPGWLMILLLAGLPAAGALGYIHYLNNVPVSDNAEDAFRHQKGRPLARLVFVKEWGSSDAVARLLGEILGASLNTEVIYKPISQDELKGMIKMLAENQGDIAVSVWLPHTHMEMLKDFRKETVDLGAYLQGARMGLAVSNGSPAQSIAQLQAADYGGVLYGIDPGSGLNRHIRQAMEDYGLHGFTLVEKNDRYLAQQLQKTLAEKKNAVFAAWSPDWIFGEYPVRMLEDPLKSFPDSEEIHLVLSKSFAKNYPRLAECLRQFQLQPAELSELMAQIRKEAVPGQAVQEWIVNHRLLVSKWIEPMLK